MKSFPMLPQLGGRLAALVCAGVVVIGAAPAAVAAAEPAGTEPGHHAYNGAPTVISGHPAPTLNGVPCVSGNLGACTGFAQNQPVPKKPRSSIGHTPTIR